MSKPLRLLILGNSSDMKRPSAGHPTRAEVLKETVERELATDVEMMVRTLWPDGRLLERIERWLSEFEPDAVFLSVPGYWFLYESVPLKVQRTWGPVGRWIGGKALAASDGDFSRTRLSRRVRRILLRVVGGSPQQEPQETLDDIEPCIRAIVRRESVALAVRTPQSNAWWSRADYNREWRAGRLAFVRERLLALCDSLSVPTVAERTREERAAEELERDEGHRSGAAFEANATNDAAALIAAIRQAGVFEPVPTRVTA